MRAIPETSPRRRPRQARAQATVDAIIKATSQVLVQEGYDRASTNRIALAAGVSIGSLYQYFPSKEALVAALVEQHLERMDATLREVVQGSDTSSVPAMARVVVEALITAYRVDPRLHEVLCQEVPKIGELRRVYRFEEQLAKSGREFLSAHREAIGTDDLDRAVFLLANAVPSVIRAAITADPEGERDAELATELTNLILRYLMVQAPN